MTFEEQMRNDGWKNTYDEHPKVAGEYLVQDHNGNRFKAMYYINKFGTRVWKGDKGYDICWWKGETMEQLTGEILNINNEYDTYQEYKAAVDAELQRSAESFVRIGYLLKVARDTDILKESGYGSVNEFAEKEYGLDKSQVSRFIRINDEYSEGGYSDKLQEKYRDFGYAKLAMMLTLPAAVSEELTAAYTKSEIGMLKEEIDEENKVSDLEVMMEEPDRQQESYGLVGKVLHQLGHDDPDMYLRIFDAVMKTDYEVDGAITPLVKKLTEALAPSGEAMHSVRIAGEGRKLLSVKGPDVDPVIIDVRRESKTSVGWNNFIGDAQSLYSEILMLEEKEGWEKLYGEPFPVKEEPKNTTVAPVQPKKEKKVTKAKVEKPTKLHKEQAESRNNDQEENHETEEQAVSQDPDMEQSAAVSNNADSETPDIDRNEAEPTDNASGTNRGDGTPSSDDDEDAGNEPPAAGQIDGQMNIEDFPEYMPEKGSKPQQLNAAAGYLMVLKDNLDIVYSLAEKGNIAGAEARLEAVRGTLHKIAELTEA